MTKDFVPKNFQIVTSLFSPNVNFGNLSEISRRELSWSEILPVNHRKRALFTVNYPEPGHYNNPSVSLAREPHFARIKLRIMLPPAR